MKKQWCVMVIVVTVLAGGIMLYPPKKTPPGPVQYRAWDRPAPVEALAAPVIQIDQGPGDPAPAMSDSVPVDRPAAAAPSARYESSGGPTDRPRDCFIYDPVTGRMVWAPCPPFGG